MKWCVTCKKYVETCAHYELFNNEKWEKEFKGELYNYGYVGGISLSAEIDLKELFETYLGKLIDNPTKDGIKVEIKCKLGCIQIERIGQ